MSDNLEDAVKKVKTDIATLRDLKKELDSVFGESAINQKEDRKFQLELLKVQLGNDVGGSIVSVIVSIQVAIIAVILTLSVSLTGFVSSAVLLSIVLFSIAVTIITSLLSWFVFGYFRNRRIRQIEKEFINTK